MKHLLVLFLLSGFVLSINAQNWDRRHSFAKSYFGISNYVIPNLKPGSFLNEDDVIQQFKRNGFISPAINIGATHFWGYTDIYISINTANIKFKKDEYNNQFNLSTFTGLRFYPLQLKDGNFRPFIGYKFSPFEYSQKDFLSSRNSFIKSKIYY